MTKKKALLLGIIIVVALLLLVPESPIRTAYSKYVLSNNAILSKLPVDKNNCHFESAIAFGDTPQVATVVCLTNKRYQLPSVEITAAVNDMRKILEDNGWTFASNKSSDDLDVVYTKGLRKIRIYPYDWDPNLSQGAKLFVRLS